MDAKQARGIAENAKKLKKDNEYYDAQRLIKEAATKGLSRTYIEAGVETLASEGYKIGDHTTAMVEVSW